MKYFQFKKFAFIISLLTIFSNSFGQITTAVNPSIAQMQALLQGNGVTVSGLSITCPAGAYATFANGAGALGGTLNSGILLTTGTASNIAGPPTGFASTDNSSSGGGGSALGNTLSGGTTFDGCYINFLITPSCATLSINYVFASEEYPEFATGLINDVFGFVISGPNPLGGNYNQFNTALLPVTTTTSNVVSIQNVNNGSTNTGPCTNCAYYIDSPPGLIYDGKTPVMTASCAVTPCQTYTMTIGVWDDSDGIYDSGVFLDVNGLSCANQPSITATVNPTTTCGPQTVTLTATGGFAIGSYTWSAPASGGLTATTGSIVTANPTAATTYTVKYSDINTCPGFPVTQTVAIAFTAAPALPVSQTPTGIICAGQSLTLTANGGAGTYSWSPSASLTSPSSSITSASPTITTTYTVTKTVGACVSQSVITVSVGSSSVSITPSLSVICAGQSQSLTASGAGPFVWTASSGANPPAVGNVTVTPAATTTYTVLSGTGSCTSTAVATVSISASLSIAITPSLSIICLGQSQALSSSGSGPFVWTASSGANPAAAANVTVTPTTTTTYTVLSGTGTCTASAVATVSISLTPSISITPSLSTICLGQSQALSSSGAGPFIWTASSGANPAAVANVTVTPTTTTTYSVLSGAGTCTASAVAIVSISATPAINITPSNTTICLGESVALSSTGAGPFVWTASTGATPAAAANVTVNPTSTTTYTVLSGTGACTAQAVATVSIGIPPAIAITPNNTVICLGESVNLNTTGTGPFVWTASNGANPAPAASVIVSPTSNTTYTVLSGVGACTVTAIATVSISPTLSVNITPTSTIICVGQNANLSASGVGPFVWTASTGSNPAPTGSITVNPIVSTTYTVLAGTGACTAQAVTNVNVLPSINPTLVASSPFACLTKTVSISTSPITPGLTYTWQPTASISGSNNTASIVVVPTSTAPIIFTVTISNGVCIGTNTVQIQVQTPPVITNFTTLNNDTICVGGCVTFSANVTGSSPILFQWFYESGIGTSSVGIAPEACYPSAGNFSVVATASNTCGFDTLMKSNFVTVYDLPVLLVHGDTTINIGNSAQVYASGGLTYNWTPNINGTIACPTCSNTVVSPTVSTNYIVVASNSPYCRVQDTVKVIVDVNCGDFFIPNVFSPNGDGLNDVINVHGRCISTFNLQIFSRWGEKVFETSSITDSWDGTFRGQKMDTGVFVYKADGVSIDGQSFKLKGNITLIR